MCDDALVHRLQSLPGREGVEVVEQPSGLVLLGVQAGETQQAALVVAGIDHLGLDADDVRTGLDVELGDVESQRIETPYPRLHLRDVAAGELLGLGELCPQLVVASLDGVDEFPRVQVGVEQVAGLQVQELAVQVRAGDLQIVLPLAGGELIVQLPGLGVDEVGGEGLGVPAEQHV